MQVTLATEYTYHCETKINLPNDKTFKDIKEIYVRWGDIFVHFKDKTVIQVIEDNGELGDCKHPDWLEAYDEDGTTLSGVKEWLHGE